MASWKKLVTTGGATFTGNVNIANSSPFLYVGDSSSNNEGSWDANIMLDSNAHARLRIENRGNNRNLQLYSHTGSGTNPRIQATDSSTGLLVGVANYECTFDNSGTITTPSDGNSENWKAAYDWGNHASAGYSTSDTTYSAGTGLSLSSTTFSIANGGVDTTQLANDSVTNTKLADNAVQGDIIMDETISAGKLSDDSVSTDNIIDDAVTGAKIASNTISYLSFSTNNSAGSGQYLQAQGGGTGMGWQTLTVNNGNWSGTDLSVANGGTGASSASTARGKNNLDVNQAGYHGYPTRIKILPTDLRPDDDISTSNVAIRSAYYGGSASVMHSYLEAFASFQIPSGFKATSTTLYTSVNLAFAVYENAINSSSGTYKGNGTATSSGGTSNHTDITATDTNYMTIRLDFTATSQLFYGGYITIARV